MKNKRFASTKLDEYPKSLAYKLYLDSFLKEKLFKTSFKMGNINFKIFNNKKTYYQSKDDFYFSILLFDNQKEMENYIFGVIKIIDLLDKFQLVSKEKK